MNQQNQKNNEGQDNPNPLDKPAIPVVGNFPMRRVEPVIARWHPDQQTRSVPSNLNGSGGGARFRILP